LRDVQYVALHIICMLYIYIYIYYIYIYIHINISSHNCGYYICCTTQDEYVSKRYIKKELWILWILYVLYGTTRMNTKYNVDISKRNYEYYIYIFRYIKFFEYYIYCGYIKKELWRYIKKALWILWILYVLYGTTRMNTIYILDISKRNYEYYIYCRYIKCFEYYVYSRYIKKELWILYIFQYYIYCGYIKKELWRYFKKELWILWILYILYGTTRLAMCVVQYVELYIIYIYTYTYITI